MTSTERETTGGAATILEVSDTRDGGLALTMRWPDGEETLEEVSVRAAALLGFVWGDDTPTPPAPVEPGDAGEGDAAWLEDMAARNKRRHAEFGPWERDCRISVQTVDRLIKLARRALARPSTSATADDDRLQYALGSLRVIASGDCSAGEAKAFAKAGLDLADVALVPPTPTAWKRPDGLTTMDKAVADQWRADGHGVEAVPAAVVADAVAGLAEVSEDEMEALRNLIDGCVRFADHAAGEGLSATDLKDPAEVLCDYANAVGLSWNTADDILPRIMAVLTARVRAPGPARPDAARGEAVAGWAIRDKSEPRRFKMYWNDNESDRSQADWAERQSNYEVRPLYAATPIAPTLAAWIAPLPQIIADVRYLASKAQTEARSGKVDYEARLLQIAVALDRLAAATPADAGGMARAVEKAKNDAILKMDKHDVSAEFRCGAIWALAEIAASLFQADARQDVGGVK